MSRNPIIAAVLSSPVAHLNTHLKDLEESGKLSRVSKYGNVKTVEQGIKFDSKKEAERYGQLKMMLKAGLIGFLKMQEEFQLHANGEKIASYFADFNYIKTDTGEKIVEDVKSKATRKIPVYRLKKKLMKACHGIKILEV